jgi:hypothetical protein
MSSIHKTEANRANGAKSRGHRLKEKVKISKRTEPNFG